MRAKQRRSVLEIYPREINTNSKYDGRAGGKVNYFKWKCDVSDLLTRSRPPDMTKETCSSIQRYIVTSDSNIDSIWNMIKRLEIGRNLMIETGRIFDERAKDSELDFVFFFPHSNNARLHSNSLECITMILGFS